MRRTVKASPKEDVATGRPSEVERMPGALASSTAKGEAVLETTSVGSMKPGDAAAAPAVLVEDFSFSYPSEDGGFPRPVFERVSLRVEEGAFCVLVGSTGSGKTTLLRSCKPELAPVGEGRGRVSVFGRIVFEGAEASGASAGFSASEDPAEPVESAEPAEPAASPRFTASADSVRLAASSAPSASAFTPLESAASIGYLMQDPSAQIVCDTVWHEMAFGLENLGFPQDEMRRRVAEAAHFFGIEPWIRKKTEELSGGQKQLVNLAAVLALRPKLLLLDEPTAQLAPNAVKQFLFMLARVNRELGVTVLMATHSPEDVAAYATQRIDLSVSGEAASRSSVEAALVSRRADRAVLLKGAETALSVRDLHFRFGRQEPWILRGANLRVARGSVHALVGGNGCGKTTLLRCLAGVLKPQRGRLSNALARSQAMLPQDPKALFVCDSVREELMEWSGRCGYGWPSARQAAERFSLEECLERHPYDLSGGQQQKLALAKLLLTGPQLLMLDEPTKGLDPASCAEASRIVRELADEGRTVVLVTHDLDFALVTADEVSMVFDGGVTCTEPAEAFFANNLVYRPNDSSRLFGEVLAGCA